jgi:tetratricopeptide (TPR) repeat protein
VLNARPAEGGTPSGEIVNPTAVRSAGSVGATPTGSDREPPTALDGSSRTLVALSRSVTERVRSPPARVLRPGHAIAACDELLTRSGDADTELLREAVDRVLQMKAYLLRRVGKRGEAAVVADALMARLDEDESPTVLVELVGLENERAAELVAAELFEEGLDAFDGVITRLGDASDPVLRGRVSLTITNKVATLMQLGRVEEARVDYENMVARFGDDAIAAFDDVARQFTDAPSPQLRRHGVAALVNRAGILSELNRTDEALAAFDQVITRFEDDEDEGIQDFVAQAREHRSELLGEGGDARGGE